MKLRAIIAGSLLCALSVMLSAKAQVQSQPSSTPIKLVTLGGSVTEIVYDLGQQDKLIGTDLSSLYPEAATKLPRIGYYRQVPVEGVVSLAPTLVLASANSGPKASLQKIAELGIRVEEVSDEPHIKSLYKRIAQVANALHVPEQGRQLVQSVQREVAEALALKSESYTAALVVNRTGSLMAAGQKTAANELMSLAGFKNIFADQAGYKPVSKESFLHAQPEVVITTTTSVEASGGLESFKANPMIADTPAAQHNRIVVMDDLLALGLGPRVASAIKRLKQIGQGK